jgi:hypothetical protein
MPTYRNDSTTQTWRGRNFSGEAVNVHPGELIGTCDIVQETFMTKTDDDPFATPVLSWSVVNLGVGKSGEIAMDQTILTGLDVFNRVESSGEALVYFNDTSSRGGALAARLAVGRAISFPDNEVQHKVNKVVIESSLGSVVEVRGSKK